MGFQGKRETPKGFFARRASRAQVRFGLDCVSLFCWRDSHGVLRRCSTNGGVKCGEGAGANLLGGASAPLHQGGTLRDAVRTNRGHSTVRVALELPARALVGVVAVSQPHSVSPLSCQAILFSAHKVDGFVPQTQDVWVSDSGDRRLRFREHRRWT